MRNDEEVEDACIVKSYEKIVHRAFRITSRYRHPQTRPPAPHKSREPWLFITVPITSRLVCEAENGPTAHEAPIIVPAAAWCGASVARCASLAAAAPAVAPPLALRADGVGLDEDAPPVCASVVMMHHVTSNDGRWTKAIPFLSHKPAIPFLLDQSHPLFVS